LRNSNFVCWNNSDVITHEVMGGLKNAYSIGMGIITAATNNSATSKAVYFSNAGMLCLHACTRLCELLCCIRVVWLDHPLFQLLRWCL